MSAGSGSEIVIVDERWERMGEVLGHCYEVLYRSCGVLPAGDWFCPTTGCELAVALDPRGAILGTARLLPGDNDREKQIRHVAVRPESRGCGLGKALVATLEWRAADDGADTVWLNARESAISFYQRLGFVAEGGLFDSGLTRLRHLRMRKRLRPAFGEAMTGASSFCRVPNIHAI
ncbi:MAG: GNAT family N-acetyltransferase [Coriobacteriales bacterium]|nr:GNAT family N-acetyltransferase [Coriobacteriales bacterium]